jgi:hypothetical protein
MAEQMAEMQKTINSEKRDLFGALMHVVDTLPTLTP